jgi:hypothetical protein
LKHTLSKEQYSRDCKVSLKVLCLFSMFKLILVSTDTLEGLQIKTLCCVDLDSSS